MIIDLKLLNRDTLNLIPQSLRVGKTELNLDDLPLRLQHELRDVLQVDSGQIFVPENVFDLTPKSSIYNDFEPLLTERTTLIEYIQNYLQTGIGSYPFDPLFGSSLKKHLQTKDTGLRSTLISAELDKIIKNINTSFNANVKVISSAVNSVETGGGSEYFLSITVDINDEIVTFTL